MQEEYFLIWSYEHRAWWKPNSMGYTLEISEAGIYNREATSKILDSANLITVNEIAVESEIASSWKPYVEAKKDFYN